jgi:two-component system cell cycle response regulator DivK
MAILNLQNKKVLIVEDDDMSYLYLNQLFLLTQATVIRQKTGVDAIEEFRTHGNYDLILMDIQLPDMDGKQVTREIRKMNAVVPVIAQTASRAIDERDIIMEAGCSEVMTKPFTMDELFGIIGKYLQDNT